MYKGEDQLIWESIVFITVIEKFLGNRVLPIFVPLVTGDMFRIFCVQKNVSYFEVVDLCSYSFRSREGQEIWYRVCNYAISLAKLIIQSEEQIKAKNESDVKGSVKPLVEEKWIHDQTEESKLDCSFDSGNRVILNSIYQYKR